MCGFCGIAFADRERNVSPEQVTAMSDVISHRGPDDSGFHIDKSVALGHRRLSIVDLAAGHQPMSNEDGSVWIAFNGEIYNHTELRPALEQQGHRYRTRSDTETIIHLVEQHGKDAPAFMRGMFAFAAWDSRERSLLLARDHTGIKPLYFAPLPDGSLVFGSEIKTIFASGLLVPDLESDVVDEYLTTGHVSGDRTLYRGVRKLEAGTTLTWRDGRYSIDRYWTVGDTASVHSPPITSIQEAADEFWTRFLDSVRSQLMSDVPLGVFLSGGLDSSLLVAAMRAAGVPEIRSFSVGYREAEASELPWARLVADRLGTQHHEVLVDGADFFHELPELTWQRDLPLTFSASIPLYHVSRLARTHVKVVLTGEGSDEIFAGYGRYPRALLNLRWARRLDRALPGSMRRSLIASARRGGSGFVGSRIARSFLAKPGTFEASCLEPFAEFTGRWSDELLTPDIQRRSSYGNLDTLVDRALLEQAPLEAMLRYDQRTYMEELLMKQDSMSMATSIESRVPFLDHLLVEWAASLPASVKLHGRTGKALVREAARAHLPGEVVDGPKRGFLVPLARWLRDVGRDSLEHHMPAPDDGLFNTAAARTLVTEHLSGLDHTGRLWRLLAFQIWRNDTLPRMARLAEAARASNSQTVSR